MDYKRFQTSWFAMVAERNLHRVATPALAVAVLLLVMALVSNKPLVILIPPKLTEQVRLSMDSADEAYKRSWGLFVATMVGNVTPGNADYMLKNVEGLLSPHVYQSIKENLADQVQRIKRESMSIAFQPREVQYEIATDRIFVFGKAVITGSSGEKAEENRTYELEVDMVNGIPTVTYFDLYSDKPKTSRVREHEARAAERAKQSQQESP